MKKSFCFHPLYCVKRSVLECSNEENEFVIPSEK